MHTLLFSLLLAAAPAPATDAGPLITRSTLNESALSLTLANLEQHRTTVTLSAMGTKDVFFEERIKDHNGYCVNLILDKLPEGRYVLSVAQDDEVRRQVILKSATGILCSDWK